MGLQQKSNMCVIRAPVQQKDARTTEVFEEIKAEPLSNLAKDTPTN